MDFWRNLVESKTTMIAGDYSAWVNLEAMVETGKIVDTYSYYAPAWGGADFVKVCDCGLKYLTEVLPQVIKIFLRKPQLSQN